MRARSGGESGDRDTKVIKALSPIFQEAYVQSLERRTCRLQPKFFGELAQVRPSRSASRFDRTSADHLLFFVQRQSSLLPLALLNSLAPATATATIASNYLRAEAAALLQVRQFLTEPIAYWLCRLINAG